MVAGAAWSWGVESIKLQVLSSTEAEYVAGASVCRELLHARQLFAALRMGFPQPCTVFQDNMSAIAMVCGPSAQHARTKHLDVKYHFQRQLLVNGIIRVQHLDTACLPADLLTKILSKESTRKHREVLLGQAAMQVISKELPDSQKSYVQRHNEELKRQRKRRELKHDYDLLQAATNGQR